jgi:peptide-methionine (S)-S-oxide reductase
MQKLWLGLSVALLALSGPACAFEGPRPIPAPAVDDPATAGDSQTAVLSGGCYWGMQSVFEHIKGVKQVVAGMSGLPKMNNEDDRMSKPPSEAVEITFDPSQITYGRLLQIFFSVAHDPTEVDKQGPDVGARYRSVIYYGDDQQKKVAQSYVAQLDSAHVFGAPISTSVDSLIRFHKVDDSQQDYGEKHPTLPYIVNVDAPKLVALKVIFPALYLEPPTTLSPS